MLNPSITLDGLNQRVQGNFAGYLGIEFKAVEEGRLLAELPIKAEFMAANGYLHAGSIVTFADSVAGFSVIAHLPEKARSFTTIELKTNFLRTATEGVLVGESYAEHLGRSTQVWRVVVRNKETGKKMAIFTCTQLIIYEVA